MISKYLNFSDRVFGNLEEVTLKKLIQFSNLIITLCIAGIISVSFSLYFEFDKLALKKILREEEYALNEIYRDIKLLEQIRLLADLSTIPAAEKNDEAQLVALGNSRLAGQNLTDNIINSLDYETENLTDDWAEIWADARQFASEDVELWALDKKLLTAEKIESHYKKLIALSERYLLLSLEYQELLQEEIDETDEYIKYMILSVFFIQILGFIWGTRGDALIERARDDD